MISGHLTAWASKTQQRRIVLQVVDSPEGGWRAEAIDEHGSTVEMVFDDEPEWALRNLGELFAVKRIRP